MADIEISFIRVYWVVIQCTAKTINLFLFVFMEPAIKESWDFCALAGAAPSVFVGLTPLSLWGSLLALCGASSLETSSCSCATASWVGGWGQNFPVTCMQSIASINNKLQVTVDC